MGSRQLLIFRHAKSAWDTEAATDFDRPLAARGKRDAPKMGRWLLQQGLIPDYVVCSPAKRAKQTAKLVTAELNIDKGQLIMDQRIYDAGPQSLLQVLADCPKDARLVLLVGHNPGVEMLLEHLCGSEISIPDDGKVLPTATLAHMQMPSDWADLKTDCAHLDVIMRPKNISE